MEGTTVEFKGMAGPSERKAYALRVGELSQRYNIPFEVGLALGDNESKYYRLMDKLFMVTDITPHTIRNLYAGIDRRKNGLFRVLGKDLYMALEINSMGQKNSQRLAEFVAKECQKKCQSPN